MLFTLYYMAATWIQSWRLHSMRTKLLQVFGHNGSIVLYKEQDPSDTEGLGLKVVGASSVCCENKAAARVGDLLWFVGDKRGCSLYPQQRIDATQWISFQSDKSLFPIELSGKSDLALCDAEKLHLLVEADYLKATSIRDVSYCEIEQFGIPKAWKVGDYFSLILETDINHLAKLGTNFMMTKISIDDGMELIRIESVVVEGRPCILLNIDSIPVTRSPARKESHQSQEQAADALARKVGQQMSPLQWRTHIELLQSFARAAEKAANALGQHVPVSGHMSAVLTAGDRALTLDIPTAVDIGEDEPSQSRHADRHIIVSQDGENISVGILEEERSIESFHSFIQDERDANVAEGELPGDKARFVTSHLAEKSMEQRSASPRESKSSDSFCSLGSASTLSLTSHSGEKSKFTDQEASGANSDAPDQAAAKSDSQRGKGLPPGSPACKMKPVQKRGANRMMKPPNILVYSESNVTLENVIGVLHSTLQKHKYTVYAVTRQQLSAAPWSDNTVLLVLCGTVPDALAPSLLSYLLGGGHILGLCSDFLHLVLPTFKTAEVRERELVRFSYGRWRQVRMMHHIFCYQASPAHTRFAQDQEEVRTQPPPKPPSSVEVMDADNKPHTVQLQVLGAEETWHTPSLLLATVGASGGKAVFSQVHLEVDPTQYEEEESKYSALQQSDKARLEILRDLLTSHLGLECSEDTSIPAYTPAYFLGRHELKLEFLKKLQSKLQADSLLKLSLISLQFCGKGVEPCPASSSVMPVLIHSCPANFSTVEYFENLHSETLGRLMIYSDVMTSSMHVLNGAVLQHGLAVVPLQQTNGIGECRRQRTTGTGVTCDALQGGAPTRG